MQVAGKEKIRRADKNWYGLHFEFFIRLPNGFTPFIFFF